MPSVKRSGANATNASESGEGVPEGAHGQGAEERVQVSQNLSLPSNDELEHFRKTDLQAYLKATGRMGWMAHQKWKEAKQLPGNMLGCC